MSSTHQTIFSACRSSPLRVRVSSCSHRTITRQTPCLSPTSIGLQYGKKTPPVHLASSSRNHVSAPEPDPRSRRRTQLAPHVRLRISCRSLPLEPPYGPARDQAPHHRCSAVGANYLSYRRRRAHVLQLSLHAEHPHAVARLAEIHCVLVPFWVWWRDGRSERDMGHAHAGGPAQARLLPPYQRRPGVLLLLPR